MISEDGKLRCATAASGKARVQNTACQLKIIAHSERKFQELLK
jgi:hypothetical protein